MDAVFFGTPDFAVPTLLALAASRHRLLAAVTQPDRPRGRGLTTAPSPVKRAAAKLGLTVLEPTRLRDELVEKLRALAPQVLVVIAYGRILPPELLAVTPERAINVHASLLPRHRGAAPIQAAILAGDAETGVTTMEMDAGLDQGPMLLQSATPIGRDETAGELTARLAAIGSDLLLETLDRLERGDLAACAQDTSQASYAPRLRAEDAVLDWRQPALVLARRIRAFDPWPGAVTALPGGRRLKLGRTHVLALDSAPAEPGTVLRAGREGVEVACGQGILRLEEVKPEGKRAMAAADLVHGRLLRVGERLGG